MTLKAVKEKIIQLLEKKDEKKLIELLNNSLNDKKLAKEFEKSSKDEEKYNKAWKIGKTKDFYYASNWGNVRINQDGDIIPQKKGNFNNEDLNNIYLDTTNYKNLAKYTKVYNFVAFACMKNEYDKLQLIYPEETFVVHHIYNYGDNRVENMVYLPRSIHNKVNHNYKANILSLYPKQSGV